MAIQRKFSELLQDIVYIIEDLDSTDTDKASALKTLMIYDRDRALDMINEFIEAKAVWALKLALEIKKSERDRANDHTNRLDLDGEIQ